MLKSTEPRHSWEELGSEEEENTVELIEDPPHAPPLVEKGNILDMTCRWGISNGPLQVDSNIVKDLFLLFYLSASVYCTCVFCPRRWWASMWLLWIKPGSLTTTRSALNHWANSPVLRNYGTEGKLSAWGAWLWKDLNMQWRACHSLQSVGRETIGISLRVVEVEKPRSLATCSSLIQRLHKLRQCEKSQSLMDWHMRASH